jgi:tetratricopeptide (TPR) repeat protein
MHAAAHMAMGGLSIRDGDYADAERRLSQAEILFRQHGGRYHLMAIRNERGELARYRGDLAAAARYYEEAWVGMRAANPQTASVYRMNLAMVAVLQRDWIRARANLDAALAALETHGMRPVIGAALVMRLCVDAAEHDWTLWDTHIERARTLLHEASFFDEDTARMAALAASLAHSAGEPTRAASAMGIATTQLRGLEQG